MHVHYIFIIYQLTEQLGWFHFLVIVNRTAMESVNSSTKKSCRKTYTSQKKDYEWLLDTLKRVQHHSSLMKCKLKLWIPLTPITVTTNKKAYDNKYWKGCGKSGTLINYCLLLTGPATIEISVEIPFKCEECIFNMKHLFNSLACIHQTLFLTTEIFVQPCLLLQYS